MPKKYYKSKCRKNKNLVRKSRRRKSRGKSTRRKSIRRKFRGGMEASPESPSPQAETPEPPRRNLYHAFGAAGGGGGDSPPSRETTISDWLRSINAESTLAEKFTGLGCTTLGELADKSDLTYTVLMELDEIPDYVRDAAIFVISRIKEPPQMQVLDAVLAGRPVPQPVTESKSEMEPEPEPEPAPGAGPRAQREAEERAQLEADDRAQRQENLRTRLSSMGFDRGNMPPLDQIDVDRWPMPCFVTEYPGPGTVWADEDDEHLHNKPLPWPEVRERLTDIPDWPRDTPVPPPPTEVQALMFGLYGEEYQEIIRVFFQGNKHLVIVDMLAIEDLGRRSRLVPDRRLIRLLAMVEIWLQELICEYRVNLKLLLDKARGGEPVTPLESPPRREPTPEELQAEAVVRATLGLGAAQPSP